MTELINNLQKQDPNSGGLIELFEVELDDGSYAYFCADVNSNFQSVQFRDRTNPSTIRTYVALPMEFTGFEVSTEGTMNRPRITFANVLSSFEDTIGISNEELIGKKIFRRRTLEKYLYGNSGDSSPPLEYGIQSYVIDRKETETNLAIIFELASPFDLGTIKIPRRQIIPNACNWIYQGAGKDLVENLKKGGCSWRTDSLIHDNDGTSRRIMFDKNDYPIITDVVATSVGVAVTTPAVQDSLYYAPKTLTRRNLDGSTTSVSNNIYWQALANNTDASQETPSESNSIYRRVLIHTIWNNSTTYYSYEEGSIYNDAVLSDGHIWRCKVTTTGVLAPTFGPLWERIDLCGKRLSSCAKRFGAIGGSITLPSTTLANKELPYGGFPASRTFQG